LNNWPLAAAEYSRFDGCIGDAIAVALGEMTTMRTLIAKGGTDAPPGKNPL
jgi:hypothetical protein